MTTKSSSTYAVPLHETQQVKLHARLSQFDKMAKESWKLLVFPLVLFIVVPVIALFRHVTLADFFTTLSQAQVQQAINLSLSTSLMATALSWILGTPVAYFLAERRSRLTRIVDTLIDLPTVLPPSVAGVALLLAFGRKGIFGPALEAVGISIPFTSVAVIMAQTFIAAPFYVKAASIGFASIDRELKQAAALDGASRWQTFRYIIFPMSWAALLSGTVMTWARALGEFGATIIFAGNFPGRTQTMPLAIYVGFELDLNVALTLAIILICFSFLALVLVKGILHSRFDPEL